MGTVSARWLALDVTTHDVICTHTDGNEQLECMEISPGKEFISVDGYTSYVINFFSLLKSVVYINFSLPNVALNLQMGKCWRLDLEITTSIFTTLVRMGGSTPVMVDVR